MRKSSLKLCGQSRAQHATRRHGSGRHGGSCGNKGKTRQRKVQMRVRMSWGEKLLWENEVEDCPVSTAGERSGRDLSLITSLL